MILLDVGNTRLKAARWSGHALTRIGEASHEEQGLAAVLQSLELPRRPDVLAVNVAGAAAEAALAQWQRGRAGKLSFLKAAASAGGVTCAYAEPVRLGADRWAALVGARGLTDHPCLVVDAGSALTADALDGDGRHLGGWIVPGVRMMRRALLERTGDLGSLYAASPLQDPGPFAVDTRAAIEGGPVLAAAGFVRLVRERLATQVGAPVRVLLTGGDARLLGDELPDADHQPDLVLQGLARLAV